MARKKITNIWGEEIDDLSQPDTRQTHFNYDPSKFQYFSENKIALGREATLHPKLMEILKQNDINEFEIILAQVAAYCEVILDDTYMPHELDHLCGVLVNKLITKRSGIFLASRNPFDSSIR